MHNYTNNYTNHYTASVVGATGYSGMETVKLLLNHPEVRLTRCFATAEFSLPVLQQFNPNNSCDVLCLKDSELMQNLTDFVFLATPAEVSLRLAPKLLAAGCRVIDLSGAFRLQKNDYQKWYHFTHSEPALLQRAQYGLVPWNQTVNSLAAKQNALIANPGCYASAISLALIPLLKDQLIDANYIVIDAKSGTTGAGKKASEQLLFSEVTENCLPYRIGKHQHLPEIQEAVEKYAGIAIQPQLSTYLLPVRRGIIAGIYCRTAANLQNADIQACYSKAYAQYPLLQHGASDRHAQLLSLQNVVHTANTQIAYHLEQNYLYLFSSIDNLMKGAASQAIENLNLLLDLPVATGLSVTNTKRNTSI